MMLHLGHGWREKILINFVGPRSSDTYQISCRSIHYILASRSFLVSRNWVIKLPACLLTSSSSVFGGGYKDQQWQSPVPVSAEQAWQ